MKILVNILGLILITHISSAATHGFFNNADKVAIVVQGEDSDATLLYNALNVVEQEIKDVELRVGTNFKKELSLLTTTKEKVLNITCATSTLIKYFSSCTLEIWNSPWLARTSSSAKLILDNEEDVHKAMSLFSSPDPSGVIFQSLDGKLSIKLHENEKDKKSFILEFH